MTYFGPVQWYQKMHRYDSILLECHDSFIKQTYRNRCVIPTANGVQALTVPVGRVVRDEGLGKSEEGRGIRDERLGLSEEMDASLTPHPSSLTLHPSSLIHVSDHGNWRHLHWNALVSAYGDSPFFEYYADDLRPFFERKWEFLYDFDMAITMKMCELLDIHPRITLTDHYVKEEELAAIDDFRDAIRPKHPLPDPSFEPREYYQVYSSRNGFCPNMSILDLLFNMGNEAIFYL